MKILAAIFSAILASGAAIADVSLTQDIQVTLKRGSSTVGVHGGWGECLARAEFLANAATQTSGTVTYTCQTERRRVIAAYSPAPPPPPPPPPPVAVDCAVSAWSAWTGGGWSECAGGQQFREETRSRSVTTPAENGGGACPLLTESRVGSQVCESPPTVMPPGMTTVNEPPYRSLLVGATSILTSPTSWRPSAASDGVGAFRLSCPPSHMSFDDPIVYPGVQGAAHHHTFFGNDSVRHNSNLMEFDATGGSTCSGGIANRSAYWVPSMIDTSTGRAIVPASIQVYYKKGYNAIPAASIQMFPRGLRMIAGEPMRSTPPDQWTTYTYFGCEVGGAPGGAAMPVCTANPTLVDPQWSPFANALFVTLIFPNCWNGTDLDSPDHKSHMAYSGGGTCPASHPVPLTQITYNVWYRMGINEDNRHWRLSSDMHPTVTGYSMHGDWVNGWSPDIERAWLDNCVRSSRDCTSNNLGDGRNLN